MVCSSVEYPFEITTFRAWYFFLKLEFVAFDISSTYSCAPSFLDTIGIYPKMYAVLGIVSDTHGKEVKGTLVISWHPPGAMENLFLSLLFLSDNSWGNYLTKRQSLFQLGISEGTVPDLGTFFSPLFGSVVRQHITADHNQADLFASWAMEQREKESWHKPSGTERPATKTYPLKPSTSFPMQHPVDVWGSSNIQTITCPIIAYCWDSFCSYGEPGASYVSTLFNPHRDLPWLYSHLNKPHEESAALGELHLGPLASEGWPWLSHKDCYQ